MYEVEVKVAAEHEAVRAALPDDADALGAVEQVDTYFDAPHRDFAETDEALRLRRERERGAESWSTLLAYKGPLVDAGSKTREEFESVVDDGESVRTVLERLGFEPAATVRKERERFAVGEYTVTLDAVDGLGEFVEVETERDVDDAGEVDVDADDDASPNEVVAAARDGARTLLSELGCDPDEQLRTSYLGLLLAED